MRVNTTKAKLLEGKVVFGGIISGFAPEMVEMLGRRADGLVDLWNHWGRVRPLLLEEG